MKRVIIKLNDGTHINIEGDYLQRDEEYITAWLGENIVAVIKTELIQLAYLSEKTRTE
jgi:hypothetical protein